MTEQTTNTQELLGYYENEGYKLVRVSRRTKQCVDSAWQRNTVSMEEIARWVARGGNVGLQAGEVSNWICGIDLDCEEAVKLAPAFLPNTLKIHKGDEAPSMYVYHSPDLGYDRFDDLDGERIIDIKASADGAGHMFVIEPSEHPEKGPYQWTGGFNPAAVAEVDKDELRAATGRIAVAVLLARILPAKGRHDLALALAGYLQRNGESPDTVRLIFREVWKLRGAPREHLRDADAAVTDTQAKLERDQPVTGGRTLGEMFPKLPGRIAKFLGWERADEAELTIPTDADLHLPPGYEMDGQGVYHVTYKARGKDVERVREQITHAPLVIAARTSDIHDNSESTTLLYKRADEWRHLVAPREVIAAGREITKTAAHGVPVTSNSASKVVDYLATFESYNLDRLPHTRTSQQLGWLGDEGRGGFLVGEKQIGGEVGTIEFRGADAGDEQIAGGFSERGTHKGWFSAIEKLANYPRVYLGVYGALAPPVLAIVGAPNFIIDWANPTSTGKTTTLKVAASCWGASDERSPEKVLYSWDSTRVWIERAAAVLNCLPLILDESKRARYPRAISQTLYDVANGSGRGRGTPRGLARAGAWTTVLLSTGEAPVTSFSEDGGTRARTISLWGPPFGTADESTARVVAELRQALDANYGHAGPAFVEYLANNRGAWGEHREHYREYKAKYAEMAGDEPVLGRLGEYFAALALTATLAERAGVIPEFADPIKKLWEALKASSQDADRAQLALDMVVSWMHSHEGEFYGRHRTDQDGDPIQPTTGWAGRWNKGDEYHEVAFMPDKLREVLLRFDHDPDSVLRSWRDREWLTTGEDRGRLGRKTRLRGSTPYMIVLKREAFDEEARSDVQ